MANGVMQRWLGKVLAKSLWVGSGGLTLGSVTNQPNVSAADLAALKGFGTIGTASTATLAITNTGVTGLSSVGGSTYNLAAPIAGAYKTIYSSQIGDGIRKVSALVAGATFGSTLAGAAVLNFSTAASQAIELMGLSTSAWAVVGNNGAVTLTTA